MKVAKAASLNMFPGIYSPTGNKKLGKGIASVNRMPGETCPGASSWCEAVCYAKKGFFPLQFERYRSRTIELPDKLSTAVRMHAAGDFDSVEYIQAWIATVKEHPDTLFWAYTRSWTVPTLCDALGALRDEPNVQVFASVDETMDDDEPPVGWRVAYIDGDKRWDGKGMVCLEEAIKDDGSKKFPGMTCKACTYCWRKPKGNVAFLQH